MIRLQSLSLAAIASLCIPLSALSQQEAQPVLTEGSRVRVLVKMLPEAQRLEGTLMSFAEGQLVVRPDRPQKWGSDDVLLNSDEVERLEIVTGRKPNLVVGAVAGTGIGAATGVVVGLAMCGGDGCEATSTEAALIVGALGAGAGLLVGSVLGLTVIKTDDWQEVSIETLRVEPMISQGTGLGGITLGLRLRI
jgi:hypothetical protein